MCSGVLALPSPRSVDGCSGLPQLAHFRWRCVFFKNKMGEFSPSFSLPSPGACPLCFCHPRGRWMAARACCNRLILMALCLPGGLKVQMSLEAQTALELLPQGSGPQWGDCCRRAWLCVPHSAAQQDGRTWLQRGSGIQPPSLPLLQC